MLCPIEDELWNTALCKVWPFTLSMDSGRYVIASVFMALIVLLFHRNLLKRRKIQADRRAQPKDYLREIVLSLRSVVCFSLVGVGIFFGKTFGIFTLYKGFAEHSAWYMALCVVGLLIFQDTYFYWTHRLMHLRRLFRWTHMTHHKSWVPTPFTAYSFSLFETAVQAAPVPLWLLVVPTHVEALFVFLALQIFRNAQGHCGYEFHSARFGTHWFWRQFTTPTHHDLHHSSGRYNFGLWFRWWDLAMGTEHPQYMEKFLALTAEPQAQNAGEQVAEPGVWQNASMQSGR